MFVFEGRYQTDEWIARQLAHELIEHPAYLNIIYNDADIIFHDCETSSVKSGVHAHFTELSTLDKSVKNKMWLYHYDSQHTFNPLDNDFCGFVKRGQVFNF